MAAQGKHVIFCHLCPNHCSVKATVEHGKVIDVEEDKESGLMCDVCPLRRGRRTIVGTLNSPHRLMYPLRREGERGEGKWKRISWDQALDTIAEKLLDLKKKHGPERLAMVLGEPKGMEFAFGQRFASAFGTPNVITPGNYCGVPIGQALYFTFGSQSIQSRMEDSPRVVIIWGSNILHTGGTFLGIRVSKLDAAIERGCKLVVIDPKNTEHASRADYWIKPRPVSDGVLAMGLIKVIIEEKLYDEDYIAKWTVGFDELQEHVKTFTIEDIERLTWVPQQQIKEVARLYATSKPGIIGWGNGLEQSITSFQNCRAIAILRGITGNVNTPDGGEVEIKPATFYRPGRFFLIREFPRTEEKTIGGEFKLALGSVYVPTQSLVKAILEEKPYAPKAALLFITNPLVTYPDSEETCKAFMKLDFIVVSELFHTPTTAIADIILPAATFLEHETIGYWPSWFGYVRAYPKLIDPPGEAWSDMKIINELAKRVGLKEYFWDDEKEALDYMLKPSGLTFKEFVGKVRFLDGEMRYDPNEVSGYTTPSGKVEIYSSQLKDLGYSPMPRLEELTRSITGQYELTEDYPLLMTNAKEEAFILSGYRSVAELREVSHQPWAHLNSEVAMRLGLAQGDWIYIETKKGKIKQKLAMDPGVNPKTVITKFGWWFPEEPSDFYQFLKSNINVLTDGGPPYDPHTGTPQLRGIPCRVYKA